MTPFESKLAELNRRSDEAYGRQPDGTLRGEIDFGALADIASDALALLAQVNPLLPPAPAAEILAEFVAAAELHESPSRRAIEQANAAIAAAGTPAGVDGAFISIQEAWELAGGNPGVKATRADLATSLRLLDSVCDEAAAQSSAVVSDETLVERVEDLVGMGHGAWDTVSATEISRAFRKAIADANVPSPVARPESPRRLKP